MGLFVSFLAGLLPMMLYAWFLYLLDRYEKEPIKILFGVFIWGAIFAAGAAFLINSVSSIGVYLITQSEYATQITISTMIAPVVEETLKGAAVLVVYLIFQSDFDSPLDGLIYGGITALGFAATENIWYIHKLGFIENSWQGLLDLTLIRVILVGWQHPFYTSFTGLGFAIARHSKSALWKWVAPIAGWAVAVITHFMHNLFSSLLYTQQARIFTTIWDWTGYIGLFILILLLIKREQNWMREYLDPEQTQQLLSDQQYKIACSAWRQSLVYFQARFSGNYKMVRRFYQQCGDLMHKKRQLIRHGDELGNTLEIQRLRSELQIMSDQV
jgi:RsiW-degrading membrane proteinase PrsW (M82 family)